MEKQLSEKHQNLIAHKQTIAEQNPFVRIKQLQQNIKALGKNINQAMQTNLMQLTQSLNLLENKLTAYSPDATLSRGYAFVTNKQTGELIRNSKQINKGDAIAVKLAKTEIDATINDIHEK